MTQQDVADRLIERGMDYTGVSISRVERGEQNPGIVVLETIAVIVGAPNVWALTDYTPAAWAPFQTLIDSGDIELAARIVKATRNPQ